MRDEEYEDDEENSEAMELSEEELYFEKIVLAPTVLSEAPRLLLFGILFIGGVVCTVMFPMTVFKASDPALPFSLSFPLCLLPAVFFAVKILYDLCNERYTIGKDYVRTVCGLLSLYKSDIRVKCHDIRGVDIERSIFGRILNTGDILIGSALNADMVFRMRGLSNPSLYRDIILERAEHELERISHEGTAHSGDNRYVAVRE